MQIGSNSQGTISIRIQNTAYKIGIWQGKTQLFSFMRNERSFKNGKNEEEQMKTFQNISESKVERAGLFQKE